MNPRARILVVDPDEPTLILAHQALSDGGYEPTCVKTGELAVRYWDETAYDLLLVSVELPDLSGIDLMQRALHAGIGHVLAIIDSQSVRRVVVDAMRAGAADVVTKPFEAVQLQAAVQRALGGRRLEDQVVTNIRDWRQKFAPDIVGEDAKLIEVLEMLQRVATTDCSILLTGNSGTGKELIARAVHRASPRARKPFVAVNCAAIPKELMESEIFGHAKGAFTGATDRREGKFQVADGGTLFLDEIGEMDYNLQAKLLRVVQEREFTPVGDSRSRRVDVRLVSATNQDLEAQSRAGRFREDLYYRLNVVPVHLPPLRERGEDVLRLADHFVAMANKRHNRKVPGFDESARKVLGQHAWPGNIRELQNLAERLVILKRGDGPIGASDLPPGLGKSRGPQEPGAADFMLPEQGLDINATLERIEVQLTQDALKRSGGNKAKAAELLGLKRTTLIERLKRLNLMDASDA